MTEDRPVFEEAAEISEAAWRSLKTAQRYLIWSIEHCAWWAPNRLGYTTATHRAGLYSLEEATAIVAKANSRAEILSFETGQPMPYPLGRVTEVMVPAPTRLQVDNDITCDLAWPQAERIARVDAALAAQLSRSMSTNARLQMEIAELKKKIS